jgi:prophage regulatory protein
MFSHVPAPTALSPLLLEHGFVRLPAILAVFPVSRSTWWAGVKSGRFPQPVKLGPRLTAWKVADIRRLLSEAAEDRHVR